jgi:hypothetical protein
MPIMPDGGIDEIMRDFKQKGFRSYTKKCRAGRYFTNPNDAGLQLNRNAELAQKFDSARA